MEYVAGLVTILPRKEITHELGCFNFDHYYLPKYIKLTYICERDIGIGLLHVYIYIRQILN